MADFPDVPISFPLVKTPQFSTVIINYGAAVEQRISLEPNPRYKIKASLDALTAAQYQLVLDFFIARKGAFEAFNLYDENGTLFVVRFERDSCDFEYFEYELYSLNEISFIQVNEVVT